jgi:hypothetical protein
MNVQDAETHQQTLEAKERLQAIEGIRRGLDNMKRGAGKSAEKFFREFFAENNIPEDDEAESVKSNKS